MAVKFCKRDVTPYIATAGHSFVASILGNKFIIYDGTYVRSGSIYYYQTRPDGSHLCWDSAGNEVPYNPPIEIMFNKFTLDRTTTSVSW